MIELTKVATGFSENPELANREWASAQDFDRDLSVIMADRSVTDLSYDKTDVVLTWADGFEKEIRLDANRTTNLSTHFGDLYRYYCGQNAQTPGFYSLTQWLDLRAAWQRFFETHAI